MQKEIPVPRKVEVKGIRVLTSKQLAKEYGARLSHSVWQGKVYKWNK